MKDIYKSIGERVRLERQRAGMTIEDLAARATISASFLSYIENAGKKCSLETVRKLAGALSIPPASLFDDSEDTDTLRNNAVARFRTLIHGLGKPEIDAVLDVARSTAKHVRKK